MADPNARIAELETTVRALQTALVHAESQRDLFYEQKQATWRAHADERAKRQEMEHLIVQAQPGPEELSVRDRLFVLIEIAKEAAQDLSDASGELAIPLPQPGTYMAKMMIANRMIKYARDEARTVAEKLRDILNPDERLPWEPPKLNESTQ